MLNNLGMDIESCELLRRAIGKKKQDEIKKYKEKIYELCDKNKHPREVADLIWKIADESSGYQFALAHASAYATITCTTIWLKVKYPKEFFLGLLQMSNQESDKHEIISKIKKEMDFFGISLLPPHILRSDIDYKIEGNDIRIGLSAIKGISEKSIEKLNKFRTTGQTDKFSTFFASNEAKLPLNILSAIILTGALDDQLTQTRAKTFMEACLFSLLKPKEKQWAKTLGPEYNYDLIAIVKALNEKLKDEKGKPIIKDSRRATIRKHFAPYHQIYEYNKKNEKLCAFICERFLLGFSYTTNLYEIFSPVVEDLYTVFTICGFPEGEQVRVVGEVVEAKLGKSKEKKTPYLKLDIKDHTGNLRVMAFNTEKSNVIEECKSSNGRLPKENDVVVVRGIKKDGNCIFARAIGIQETNIFLRVSELPEPEKDKDEQN
jgi:DNA polymerase III alpha subunit